MPPSSRILYPRRSFLLRLVWERCGGTRDSMSTDGWIMQLLQEGHGVVLRAGGQLDAFAIPAMRAALDDARAEPQDVVLDFTDVSFCGAAPLGLLAVTAAELAAEGNRLSVRNVGRKQARVFRLCRLDHLLSGPSRG